MKTDKIIEAKLSDKITFVLKVTLIFLVLNLMKSIQIPNNIFESAFRLRWHYCLDFLGQGTLYGGQPYCEQGPIIFLFTYLFKMFFGIANVEIASNISNLLMNAVIILLITKIVKNETNKEYFFTILILYSAFIYYPLLVSQNLQFTLFTLLFLCAFYVLYHTKFRFKEYTSGLLFALSAFTHPTALPFILVISIFYSFNIKNLDFDSIKKIVKGKPIIISGLKQMFILFAPILVLFIFFKIIFPNFFVYTFLMGTSIPTSVSNFLNIVFAELPKSITATNYAPYFVFAFLLFVFIRRRDVYTSTAFLGFISVFLIVSRYITLQYRYVIISLIFFIIVFLSISNNIKGRLHKAAFTAIILLVLVVPNLVVVFFDFERNLLRKEVEYPLRFIPEQDGYILTEYYTEWGYKRFLSDYYQYNLDKLDVITTPIPSTNTYMLAIEKYLGVNATLWMDNNLLAHNISKEKFLDEVKSLKYSLIIDSPPEWQSLRPVLRIAKPDIGLQYCAVLIPFLNYFGEGYSQSRTNIALLFRNFSHCEYMLRTMELYYNEHLDSICKKDAAMANIIKNYILKKLQNIDIDKACIKGGDLSGRYKIVKEGYVQR